MHRVVFTDLDDTLFQSIYKCGGQAGLEPAASLANGAWHSFRTPSQVAFTTWLCDGALTIPVTGRSHAALSRVAVPFPAEAIVNHGGLVLDRTGQPDAEWMSLQEPKLRHWNDRLYTLAEQLAGALPRYRVRVQSEYGVPFYVSIKSDSLDAPSPLGAVRGAVEQTHEGTSMSLHANGQNVAVLPPDVSKARAVAWLIERFRARLGPIWTVGVGDSDSDGAFMSLCDYVILPQKGQLREAFNEQPKRLFGQLPER